jgi:hypothetical protein
MASSDLDNSPQDGKPGSCCLNLETGCFYDHNPAAEPQSGGPVNLWTALFGVTDFVEIILGIEAWVKDGSLPDGASGVPRANKIETPSGETLIAQDGEERQWLKNIQYRQELIDRRSFQIMRSDAREAPMLDAPSYDGALQLICGKDGKYDSNEYLHYDEGSDKGEDPTVYLSRENNHEREMEWQIAYREMLFRSAYSKIHAHRWRKAVEETQSSRDEAAQVLAEYRGLKPEVFLWLIDNGYVALYESDRLLIGRFSGYLKSGDVLLKSGDRLLVPRNRMLPIVAPGDPTVILDFLNGILPIQDEHDALLGWIESSVRRLRQDPPGKWAPGQALCLIGDTDTGKSSLQRLITGFLAGREANPTRYFTGGSNFNGELAEAEHWAISDPTWSDVRERKKFAKSFKNAVADSMTAVEPKHNQAVNIARPFSGTNIIALGGISAHLRSKPFLSRA